MWNLLYFIIKLCDDVYIFYFWTDPCNQTAACCSGKIHLSLSELLWKTIENTQSRCDCYYYFGETCTRGVHILILGFDFVLERCGSAFTALVDHFPSAEADHRPTLFIHSLHTLTVSTMFTHNKCEILLPASCFTHDNRLWIDPKSSQIRHFRRLLLRIDLIVSLICFHPTEAARWGRHLCGETSHCNA